MQKRTRKVMVIGFIAILSASLFTILYPPYFWGKTVYKARQGERNYEFDGSISREVLESYLSRSITYSRLLDRSSLEGWAQGNLNDSIRSIINMAAKFIGRAIYTWNGENELLGKLSEAKQIAERIHNIDPEIILQACIFEAISIQVETIPVPVWVFEEFELNPESRNFSFYDMYDVSGNHHNHWGNNTAVPDMSKLETRMWAFFLSVTYIDVGIEAIHFGQVKLMSDNDPFLTHWRDILQRVRNYAKTHARRHMIICDAHAPDGGFVFMGKLLFDFHSFPQRPEEIADEPQKAQLIVGHVDSIYKRSIGGITPSGWACDSLPYLVEFDNFGVSKKPGENTGGIWIWGYDECTWYANQPEDYRNAYLWYAVQWLEENDPNGFLQMLGSRTLTKQNENKTFYYANTQSEDMPNGFNQEETIKEIWQSTPNFYLINQ